MTLCYTYTLFAPVYDAFVAPFTARARRDSLLTLGEELLHADVLLVGVGSGLDLPLLPVRYWGCWPRAPISYLRRRWPRRRGWRWYLTSLPWLAAGFGASNCARPAGNTEARRFRSVALPLIIAGLARM